MAERRSAAWRRRGAWPWLLLAVALGLGLLIPLLVGGGDTLARIPSFPPSQLAAMIAMVVLGWNLNALRLRLMLAGRAGRLGQRHALGVIMATEFATCATPGGSGGPITLLMLLARRGLRPARGSAILLIDQCCDLLFFLAALVALTAWSLWAAVGWPYHGLLGGAMAALLVALLGATAMIWRLPALLRRTTIWPVRGLPPPCRRALARRLLHFRRALTITLCLPLPTLLAIMALCMGHWLLRYSLLYLALDGLGGAVSWGWTFLVQMLAMAAGQLSLLPGGAGATELGTAALLLPFTSRDLAAAAIVIWRLVTFHFYLLAGGPVFLAMVGTAFRRRAATRRPV